MFLLHQSLLLLLIFITSCLGFPVDRRQSNLTSLADCATAALQIDQFITFTGSATQNPHISFYLTNPNAGAPGKMLCTATLASNEGSFNGSEFYSCEQQGTGFNWHAAQLKVFQYQVCTNGAVNTVSHQIIISAYGEIATTSYPGEYGGEYSETVTGSNSIPVMEVQEVQSLDGSTERSADEKNVTCGFVGSFDEVYTLGSCNLSALTSG